jgi:hypothetical protein
MAQHLESELASARFSIARSLRHGFHQMLAGGTGSDENPDGVGAGVAPDTAASQRWVSVHG